MALAYEALVVDNVDQKPLSLKHARTQLALTQYELAVEAGKHINVIRNCEKKRGRISLMSAYAVLSALNRKRTKEGLPRLELGDLDWEIRE